LVDDVKLLLSVERNLKADKFMEIKIGGSLGEPLIM